jgi:hypothetical protein
MPPQDVMQTMLTLLAGVGLTAMPKLLKGLGGGGLPMGPGAVSASGEQNAAGPSMPPALPGQESPDIASYLQMLAGQPPAGPPPGPPVPRFPVNRAPQPVVPRVMNAHQQLGL